MASLNEAGGQLAAAVAFACEVGDVLDGVKRPEEVKTCGVHGQEVESAGLDWATRFSQAALPTEKGLGCGS